MPIGHFVPGPWAYLQPHSFTGHYMDVSEDTPSLSSVKGPTSSGAHFQGGNKSLIIIISQIGFF